MSPVPSAVDTTRELGIRVQLRQRSPIPLDVGFRCDGGEVLAVVGPSGSGKSTVLRCIAGLDHPQTGEISCAQEVWLDTRVGVSLRPQRRRVGFMFQDYALFPHLTALQNVMIALSTRNGGERRKRALRLLERVNLKGLHDRRPPGLSGGQRQRVALARSLARDPAVLLLDEPFSAVDQVTRRKLRLELSHLTRSLSIPVVLVTHDLDEAQMLADRVCVLRNGQGLQVGTPEMVMNHPVSATVARLMDLRNIFEAEVQGHDLENDLTRIRWRGRIFKVRGNTRFDPGASVHWVIPPGGVLLHSRHRPSRGTRENPLEVEVAESLTIGGLTTVILRTLEQHPVSLTMDLPPHVVRRNDLRIGDQVGVSLVGAAVHLMPWEPGTA